jgi:hypothetical protein
MPWSRRWHNEIAERFRLRSRQDQERIRRHLRGHKGILRWMTNQQIPFDDMLADFRTLELIDEECAIGFQPGERGRDR